MVNFIHHVGVFLIFAATALLIIVSVSTPVWTRVVFLKGDLAGQSLKMGNWGLCLANSCSRSRLGYTDNSYATSGTTGIASAVMRGLTYALVLNPIAAGLAFLALLLSFSTHFALGIVASVAAFFAFLVTALALIIDLALFVTARNRINRMDESSAQLGNAMWLVLASLILLLVASFLVCCTHHRERKTRDRTIDHPSSYDNSHTSRLVADPNTSSPTHSTVPLYANGNTSPEMVQKNKWYQRNHNSTTRGVGHNHVENGLEHNGQPHLAHNVEGNTNNGLGVTGTGRNTYE